MLWYHFKSSNKVNIFALISPDFMKNVDFSLKIIYICLLVISELFRKCNSSGDAIFALNIIQICKLVVIRQCSLFFRVIISLSVFKNIYIDILIIRIEQLCEI